MPSFARKVSAYFIVKDAARAIDFYKEAFGATEVFRKDGGTRVAFTAVTARVRRVLADALAATKPASATMRMRGVA